MIAEIDGLLEKEQEKPAAEPDAEAKPAVAVPAPAPGAGPARSRCLGTRRPPPPPRPSRRATAGGCGARSARSSLAVRSRRSCSRRAAPRPSMTARSQRFVADGSRPHASPSASRWPRLAPAWVLLVAAAGCGKTTQLESGAVMLDLSVGSGVTTPDELRLSVYDDAGALWNDTRVPASGALVPESATRLGTVLIQPGAAPGALRVHARGLVASARVADGVLTIPAGSRGTLRVAARRRGARRRRRRRRPRSDRRLPGDRESEPGRLSRHERRRRRRGRRRGDVRDGASDDGGSDDVGGGGMDAFSCEASGACNRANGAACADSVQCSSSFCVDGVCCANACLGPCRSCNQPNNDGICQPYAQGTNPAASARAT